MFYQEILKRKKVLENQIQQLKQKLAQYPAGHMICVRNGKYIKNIHVHDGIQTNIPKKNINLVKELAEKKYFSAHLEDLLNEQSAVNTFLEHYQPYPSKTQQLMNHPIYQKVITSSMTPLSDELEKWAKDSYEKNPAYPEQLRHSCLSGQKVRSKSEVLIAQALFLHQIPFRYECALKLNDLTFFRILQSVIRKRDDFSIGNILDEWIPILTLKMLFRNYRFTVRMDTFPPFI